MPVTLFIAAQFVSKRTFPGETIGAKGQAFGSRSLAGFESDSWLGGSDSGPGLAVVVSASALFTAGPGELSALGLRPSVPAELEGLILKMQLSSLNKCLFSGNRRETT